MPPSWRLSQRHGDDIRRFVAAELAPLEPFYKRPFVNEVCAYVLLHSTQIAELQAAVPLMPSYGGRKAVFGAALSADLSEYCILRTLALYADGATAVARTAGTMGIPTADDQPQPQSLPAIDDSVAAAVALTANPRAVQQTSADLISAVVGMLAATQKAVAVTAADVAERTLRAREKEKDEITGFFEALTDEEREAQNVLKNNRLGSWGKGHTKGLVRYDQGVYDEEVAALEQRAMVDQRLGEIGEVTAMNRDLYALDAEREALVAAGVGDEVDDLGMLADDDDYGERDGDEGY